LRHFYKALKKADVPKIRFHDLRHTAATFLLKENVHPKIVQEMLGHSTITLTLDTYSHIIPDIQKEAAKKMDLIFQP
jgi:integrase